MTTILGIIGSVVAGFPGPATGLVRTVEPAGWIGSSVVGAIIVLFVVGLVAKNKRA
ncbi:GlsB/YeaQ/YmgE family stress response membrane protein [Bordetella pertussis]